MINRRNKNDNKPWQRKFNRESAQWFKIKQTASKAYQKELANQKTKKAKNIKFITQKKLNYQLKEDIAKMMQDINKLQETLEVNIAKYKSADEELLLQIVLNTNICSDNSNDKGVFPTHSPQPSTPDRCLPHT